MRDWVYTLWIVCVLTTTGLIGAEVLPGVIDKYEAVYTGSGALVVLVYIIVVFGAAKLAIENIDSEEGTDHE